MTRLQRDFGDFVYFRIGPAPLFLVSDPEFVEEILVGSRNKFVKGPLMRRARTLFGEGLLTSEEPLHLRQRRILQQAFHSDRMAGYTDPVCELAARIRDGWRDGQVLDIRAEMLSLTLLAICRVLFGADGERGASAVCDALFQVERAFDGMLGLLPAFTNRRGRRALDAFISGLIAERRLSPGHALADKGDVLSLLLRAREGEGEAHCMTETQLLDEVVTLLHGGHETTANVLSWTWYLLSQNPDCEARFHSEVDTVLEGRRPNANDFVSLPYTRMILAEAMRLYPPVWIVSRSAVNDLKIGDFHAPAGSVFLASPWVIHRDPRFYPDPERFQPERWDPGLSRARPKFSYFPFGGGARLCMGERFAWLEGVLTLATVAQRWTLRVEPGQRVDLLPLVLLQARHGIRMRIEPREGLTGQALVA